MFFYQHPLHWGGWGIAKNKSNCSLNNVNELPYKLNKQILGQEIGSRPINGFLYYSIVAVDKTANQLHNLIQKTKQNANSYGLFGHPIFCTCNFQDTGNKNILII